MNSSLAVEATFWAILFSRFQTALQFGADQIHVQRVLTTRSQPDMFRAFASYAVLGLIFSVIYTLIGWALVAFYDRHPDLTDSLDHPDQVLVHFVVARAPALVRGLIMAGVLAAIMSTLSSVINSMSSITTVDFYARFWRKGRSEQQLAATSKTFTVVHALLLLSFALWQYLVAQRRQRLRAAYSSSSPSPPPPWSLFSYWGSSPGGPTPAECSSAGRREWPLH